MNAEALKHYDFWKMARLASESPGGHASKVLADWLDEHDSPLRAHILRFGSPEHNVSGERDAWGNERPERPGVLLHDEGKHVRPLTGHWRPDELNEHSPVGTHTEGPETYELFNADSTVPGASSRRVVRYTLHMGRRHLRVIAPVTPEHLHALADAFDAAHEHDVQQPWNYWRAAADTDGHPAVRRAYHATPLARVRIGEGVANGQPFGGGDAIFEHPLHDESGARVGSLRLQPRGNGKILHVHWVGRDDAHEDASDANSLGPEAMRSAIPELRRLYPQAHLVTGLRVSGFRGRPNAENVSFPLTDEGREALRSMRGKTRLARPEGHDNYVRAINETPKDPIARMTFADYLQDHGIPGAHVVRQHASQMHNGDTMNNNSVAGGSIGDLLLLGPTSRIVNTGGGGSSRGYGRIRKAELRERPVAQLSWGGGLARIAVAHRAAAEAKSLHGGDPVIHVATAQTRDQLEHLISDWPKWAQQHARATAGAHLLATQDPTQLARMQAPAEAGAIVNNQKFAPGQFIAKARMRIRDVAARLTSKPVKLAREPVDPKAREKIVATLAKHGPIGGFYRFLHTLGIHPTFGAGMKKSELKLIEKKAKVEEADRLSEHPSVKKLKGSQRLGLVAGKKDGFQLGHVFRLLNAIGRGQLDAHGLASIMKDTRVSPEARALMHAAVLGDENGLFVGHIGDPVSAGAHWYTHAMNPLDVAFHRIFAKGAHDPNWGSVDWRHPGGPRLRHNGRPIWETAPHQVLAKAVTGFLSGQRDPADNTDVAVRMIEEAKNRAAKAGHDNWVETLPFAQHEALDRWLRIPDVYEPKTTNWDELLKWSRDPKIAAHNHQGNDKNGIGQRGFRVTGVHTVGDHVVGTQRVGNDPRPNFLTPEDEKRWNEAGEAGRGKADGVPMVSPDGRLRPKAWSTLDAVSTNMRDLQRVLLHTGSMQAAAKWLLTEHRKKDIEDVLNDSRIDGKELRNKKGEPRQRTLGTVHGDVVPGSFLFGPKMGAFFQNIHGNTPVPPDQLPDYFTRWLTADVHWTRGHNYRSGQQKTAGAKMKGDQPTESQRLPMFFAAQKAAKESSSAPTPSTTQAVDWFATKSLPGLFGLPVELTSFVHGANKVLADRGHTGTLMNDDGTLVNAPKNPPPRKAGLAHRADGLTDPAKLARFHPTIADEHEHSLQTSLSTKTGPAGAPHDVMADHMDEEGDPRAALVRGRFTEDNPYDVQARRVLGTPEVHYNSRYVVPLPDGSNILAAHVTDRFGSKKGFMVNWINRAFPAQDGSGEIHVARSYGTFMTPEEYASWHQTVDPEYRKQLPTPDKINPTKLSRTPDAITYVGGHVPGGQRAQGFWPDKTEQSSVLRVPGEKAKAYSLALAQRNGQKSALWFTPGQGSDALHVVRFSGGYPRSLSRILRKHGVSEFTITQNPVSVHVVDQGGQNGNAVKAAASEAGGTYSRVGGTANFANVDASPDRLARKPKVVQHTWETIPHTDPELRNWWEQVYNHGVTDHTAAKVMGDWLEEHNDWRHHILRKVGDGVRGQLATGHGDVAHRPYDKPDPSYSVVRSGSPSYGEKIRLLTSITSPAMHVGSLHTPEEYEALRRDAATAGVHFPKVN